MWQKHNYPNSHGVTQICSASTCGHLEIVKSSFDKNPNALTNFGATPLYLTASKGHKDIVKYLVSFNKNPNAPSIFGPTPIYIAAKHGHVNVIKILAPLIEYPNDSCTDYDGNVYTPIEIAKKLVIYILWGLSNLISKINSRLYYLNFTSHSFDIMLKNKVI